MSGYPAVHTRRALGASVICGEIVRGTLLGQQGRYDNLFP